MVAHALLQREALSVFDYRCSCGPDDAPFVELHEGYSHLVRAARQLRLSRARPQRIELVAGSVLVGRPGDEYVCTHEHHVCGDECLSFQLSPEPWSRRSAVRARSGARVACRRCPS